MLLHFVLFSSTTTSNVAACTGFIDIESLVVKFAIKYVNISAQYDTNTQQKLLPPKLLLSEHIVNITFYSIYC